MNITQIVKKTMKLKGIREFGRKDGQSYTIDNHTPYPRTVGNGLDMLDKMGDLIANDWEMK